MVIVVVVVAAAAAAAAAAGIGCKQVATFFFGFHGEIWAYLSIGH
jgi:hypothetical protein